MPTFRPPTDDYMTLAPPLKPDALVEERQAHVLFRHYDPEPRGRNVFLLVDGTYTENEPWDRDVISKIYWGGSNNDITDAEAASLTAAGYGTYIS